VGAPAGPVAGAVNLTMPLSSFLGASGQPGEVAGFGPVAAADGQALAAASPASLAPAGA
jgi:hypothetical protein